MTDHENAILGEVSSKLDILNGRRRTDRGLTWIVGVAGSMFTAAAIALVGAIWGLTISNAKLEGAISNLTVQLDTANTERKDHENRLRQLEGTRYPER